MTPTDTVTACPYKGTTTRYWTAQVGGASHPDIAWSYDFPTRQLLPIAGQMAVYRQTALAFYRQTAPVWRAAPRRGALPYAITVAPPE